MKTKNKEFQIFLIKIAFCLIFSTTISDTEMQQIKMVPKKILYQSILNFSIAYFFWKKSFNNLIEEEKYFSPFF